MQPVISCLYRSPPSIVLSIGISVPSLPKKGNKQNDSRDAPGVGIVHGSSSYLLRICHALLENTVSPGGCCVECALCVWSVC